MLTVAYVRVSSRGQDLALQRDAIERAAALRGVKIDAWFEEKRSAKVLARPELDRLRADVRAHKIARVIVFKLDRVTRSSVADAYKIVDEFRRSGTELVAVADNLTVRPGADDIVSEALIFGLALGARIERAAIGDRIAAARATMEAAGRPWGRPSRFTKVDRERIERLRREGRSLREIAVAVKAPYSSVRLVLSRKGGVERSASEPHLMVSKPPLSTKEATCSTAAAR